MITHNNDNQDKDYLKTLPTYVLVQQINDGRIVSIDNKIEAIISLLNDVDTILENINAFDNNDDTILRSHMLKLKSIMGDTMHIRTLMTNIDYKILNIIDK